ncbi:hypothetical protein [Senegalia sp. (in: firmicutes)]|uniref:hypothetical protein n=1 Tax=Senegalia sp. (in: firmicutes) TaxID=1924098 RepID=UPI003F9B3EF8
MKQFLSNKTNIFMLAFMQELEYELNENVTDLKKIRLHSSEANIDTEFKIYIKKFILKNKKKLNSENLEKKITINFSEIDKVNYNYRDFCNYKIENVLLPNEFTEDHINYLRKTKTKSVYTNPDLLFIIFDGSNTYYRTVELKSTKTNNIPGSSIQQIKPYEWVIFLKRLTNDIFISTGLYINSITSRMQFPDRSPRPQVGFNHLSDWNSNNRISTEEKISYVFKQSEEKEKHQILTDWQYYLANDWVDILFQKENNRGVPWFHNNLRKFILLFLEKYDDLNLKEREEFKKIVKELIK